ncbi:MAG: LPS export ABC transporter permease LptF [Gammaproteobacteria bacterium]|nr:LPS export ABC transporter permease LptF [Gammaproteobacteria bacterium]MCY4357352.1 LPS export ABC transporter permease LptF [Gammaproteobacteria bacterium]
MIIFRYLNTQVLQIVCVVTGILLAVALTGRFIQYLGEAVAGDKAPDILLLIMLYRVPEFLLVILPLALFLAIILAYGRMYAENEMVILVGSGISQKRLLLHTSGAIMLILFMVAVISLYLAPYGKQKMEALVQAQSQLTEIDLIVAGQFQSYSEGGRTTYAEQIADAPEGGRELNNVFVALAAEGQQNVAPPRILLAESARPEIDPESGARFMRLDNVLQYDGTPGEGDFAIGEFDSQTILLPTPEALDQVLEESTLSTAMLIGSDELSHQAELQWRLSTLLLIPVISLIAVPMSRVNPRQGRYSKLLPAALLYMAYFVSLEFCRDLVADAKLPPAIGLWWIHMIFIGVGMIAMCGNPVRMHNSGKAV